MSFYRKPTEEFGTGVLELAYTPQESQLCAFLPNTVLGNLTLVALSWLQQNLYHGNWQILQIRTLFPQRIVTNIYQHTSVNYAKHNNVNINDYKLCSA